MACRSVRYISKMLPESKIQTGRPLGWYSKRPLRAFLTFLATALRNPLPGEMDFSIPFVLPETLAAVECVIVLQVNGRNGLGVMPKRR